MTQTAHAQAGSHGNEDTGHASESRHYWSMIIQLGISGVFMYLLMYLMIDRFEHFLFNLNALYMTLAMLAPMGVAMLLLMPSMYPNRRLNLALHAVFVLMFLAGIWFTRQQIFIGDAEFLRSMIPHHSGAILMCSEADISDARIADLCSRISASQEAEISEMETILRDY
jgi:hypothetical protein